MEWGSTAYIHFMLRLTYIDIAEDIQLRDHGVKVLGELEMAKRYSTNILPQVILLVSSI